MVTSLMRARRGTERTTNIELFFDLVYVFATTQLAHRLLSHPTAAGALQSGLLLAMVWLAWVYTTWVTNWLDPERPPVRLALFGLWASSAPSWVLGAGTSAVVAAVTVVDRIVLRRVAPPTRASTPA